MMAELRGLDSPDLLNLKSGTPSDPECFSLLIEASIGSTGERGEDIFGFVVSTPKWVAQQVNRDGFLFGKGHLIVPRYDYALIWNVISSLCRRVSGDSWTELAEKLGGYGDWEFEGYRAYPGER